MFYIIGIRPEVFLGSLSVNTASLLNMYLLEIWFWVKQALEVSERSTSVTFILTEAKLYWQRFTNWTTAFQGNLKISQDARFDEYECNVMFKKYIKLIIVIEIYISWTVMENLVHVYDSLQDYKGDRDRLNTGNLFYMLIEST